MVSGGSGAWSFDLVTFSTKALTAFPPHLMKQVLMRASCGLKGMLSTVKATYPEGCGHLSPYRTEFPSGPMGTWLSNSEKRPGDKGSPRAEDPGQQKIRSSNYLPYPQSLKKKSFLYTCFYFNFYFMCVGVCLDVCLCTTCVQFRGGQKKNLIPQDWSCELPWSCDLPCGYRGIEL